MTKEEAKEFGLNLLHGILARNKKSDPSYASLVKEAIDALSKPSLPSNLDEAAEKYANKEYPDEASCGQWGTGDYEPPVNMEYSREIAKDSFKAGVECMAEQGETFKEVPVYISYGDEKEINLTIVIEGTSLEFLETGDKVIVQIRKKD